MAATIRTVTKELIGTEDLLLGEGSVPQTRAGTDYTITKLNANTFGAVKYFGTVALMKAASLITGQFVATKGYYAAGDGGGSVYHIVAPQAFDSYGDHVLANLNIAVLQYSGVADAVQFGAVYDGITDDSLSIAATNAANTFTIPTDFPDLQTAMDNLGSRSNKQDSEVTLTIEAGHALTAGFGVSNGDYSYITIGSVDATVLLDAGFTAFTVPASIPTTASNPVMFADNCTAPVWDMLVDAELKDVAGITYNHSRGHIESGGGVNNANRMGLIVIDASAVAAHECSFVNSGDGNRTTTGSSLTAFGADFSDARALTETQAAGMDVSRGSTFNCASNATQARTDLSGAAKFGLNCRRSRISASRADCTGAGVNAIVAGFGGFVEADGALLGTSTSHGINAVAAEVVAKDANIDDCGARGVYADGGAKVNVFGASIQDCTGECVYAFGGSTVVASEINVTGFLSTNAVTTLESSTIKASGLTGTPVFDVTPNILTEHGIIHTEHTVSAIGKATILNTNANVTVTHGLDYAPNDRTITIMPINALSAAEAYYISTVGATTFKINATGAVGADTEYAWHATSSP